METCLYMPVFLNLFAIFGYTFQIIKGKQHTNKLFVMVTDITNGDQQIGMYDKYYYNINTHAYS